MAQPQILQAVVGPLDNNTYVLFCQDTGCAAVIDPGEGAEDFLLQLPDGCTVRQILLTHGHFDHAAGLRAVADATGAPFGLHRADAEVLRSGPETAAMFGLSMERPPEPDFWLSADESLKVGSLDVEVRHTPGHSPGGVVLLCGGYAFVGDSLFAGSIGRTDLPGSNHMDLMDSLAEQILTLPDDTAVLSGHGPATTIGQERRSNPFLR